MTNDGKTFANVRTMILASSLLLAGCHSLEGQRNYLADADPDTGDTESETETALEEVGSLIRGTHHTELDYLDGTVAGSIWLPLPLDHATQVPLHVELLIDPPAIVDSIAYSLDEQGNFGAQITLAESGTAAGMSIHWDAVVIARRVSTAEKPELYDAVDDPDLWADATAIADATHPGISSTAEAIVAGAEVPLDLLTGIVDWTSTNIEYPTDWTGVNALDATTAYETGKSSSTGFANLATALGRAAGLPSRTIADLFVDMSQNTHYLNELYLGPELGWRRVEPQADVVSLPEDLVLTLRIVLPADEGADAYEPQNWAFPGTPLFTQIKPLSGYDRMVPNWEHDYFVDCPGAECNNRAQIQAELTGTPVEMAQLFDLARELWQRDLLAYVDAGLAQEIVDARRAALDADDLTDIAAILSAIE